MSTPTLNEKILEILHAYYPAGAADEQVAKDIAALFRDHYHRSQRVKEALVKARQEGKTLGRPPAGEEQVKLVVSLLDMGKSIREIEAETGINRGKVARIRKHHFALDLV